MYVREHAGFKVAVMRKSLRRVVTVFQVVIFLFWLAGVFLFPLDDRL